VTGARRGIGRATVEMLAGYGANVWACARKEDEAFEEDMAELAAKYRVWIEPVYFDLGSEDEIKQGFKKIRAGRRTMDALCNVAGVSTPYRRFQMIPMKDFREVFEANFFGQVALTQLVSRTMMQQRSGSIVNVSSIAGSDGFFASADYDSSKAAVIGMTRQEARELGQFGIRVNHVSPGVTETEMLAKEQSAMLDSLLPAVALGRFGRPEEIAQVIAFLCSDMSSYITAQEIRVDGGATSPKATW